MVSMKQAEPAGAGATAVVELRDLHKSFGALEVLKGISFTAREGQVVSLIGSSGSGKSTLLRCINMLEIPDRGDVLIDGEPLPAGDVKVGQNLRFYMPEDRVAVANMSDSGVTSREVVP